jgi:hypothetical protein
MLSRVGGRLVVSPLAFLATGLVDFALFGAMYVRWLRSKRAQPPEEARHGTEGGT